MKRRALATFAIAGVLVGAGLLVLGRSAGDEPAPVSGPRPPVVLIAFDEFPIDAMRLPDGRIDPERFPNFARLSRQATWWPNAITAHDSTPRALPAILDGRRARDDVPATAEGHPGNVFTLFGERGYAIFAVEEATDICPPELCPGAADKRHGILQNLTQNGREERLEAWMDTIRSRSEPAFYFKHVLLPHLPWIYLPSGHRFDPSVGTLASTDGFHDRGLTAHNEERLLLQIGYVDHQLGRLVRKMEREGIYDDALIAVVADHGISFEVAVSDRRKVTNQNVHEVAPVPFFVKAPGQSSGGVNPALVSTADMVPTIADVLGIRPGWKVDGVSGFSAEARGRRVARIPRRYFDGFVALGARALERRRLANVARRARLFGTGPESLRRHGQPFAGLYRNGRNGWMVGRRVSAFATSPGLVRGVFALPHLWRNVNPRAEVVPVQAAGHVLGAAPEATREVAVAVNGRIEGTGRTFHLRGPDKSEIFSVMVPEESLRRGHNAVRLYEVVGSGSSVALLTLASERRPPVLSGRCPRPVQNTARPSSGWPRSAGSPIGKR